MKKILTFDHVYQNYTKPEEKENEIVENLSKFNKNIQNIDSDNEEKETQSFNFQYKKNLENKKIEKIWRTQYYDFVDKSKHGFIYLIYYMPFDTYNIANHYENQIDENTKKYYIYDYCF